MTTPPLMLFVLEMDYRPNNLNKPKYRVWARTVVEAIEYSKRYFTWLKLYSIELATKDDFERFTKTPEDLKLYTYNYWLYTAELKRRGFL